MGPMGLAMQVGENAPELHPAGYTKTETSEPGAGRERLLLDFGWRFHFGNADDPAKDFEFGSGRTGNFQKTGNFLPAGAIAFDDSDWKSVDLPHDWAIELPFTNDPALASKGYYPLGRTYPATSVGWYRRVFDLPAYDASKRLTLEFDGAYRETMVVFKRLLHRYPQRRLRSVQLRCDGFCESGRTECAAGSRGCDVERWLVL
jgi:beta-galactosidase